MTTKRVWDKVRGRHLVLTPEERVRRRVLEFLTAPKAEKGCGIPPTSIAQEFPVEMNGTTQRADIVVFDHNASPLLLVECKAPDVKITDTTLAQAFRYNARLGARFVMLTNGSDHYLYEVDPDGCYTPLTELPDFF